MAPPMMIRIADGPRRFNLRAVALLRDGDRLLLQRSEGVDFLTIPGGRVEWGEEAAQTLEREMAEELGERVDVGKLLVVAENFFAVGALEYHEIDLCFEAALRPRSRLFGEGPFPALDEPATSFEWARASELDDLDLPVEPRFVHDLMDEEPPAAPWHVVLR